MANQPQSAARLAFGPFEVNAVTGELRKTGIRIRLAGQPFRILLALLADPGALVTREQLRDQLWADTTFVDFEQGLNAAVNRLRRALGDSAEKPRYIETVTGRGYRFIGSLEPEPAIPVLTPEGSEAAPAIQFEPAAKRSTSTWWIAAIAGCTAIAVAVGLHLHPAAAAPAPLKIRDTIVLADFANSTGDPVFDGTLRQGMAIQLEQSPFLGLMPEERVQQVLGLMGRPSGAPITAETALEICQRSGSAAVLEGSIVRLGSQYVLGLRARDCRTQKVLAEEQVQAEKKEDVLRALSQIASRFRAKLGESLATVQAHDTPLAEATTSSLEALKAYSAGFRVLYSTGSPDALPLMQHAAEIDDHFAMAHAMVGRLYGDIGESALAAEATRRAYALRARTNDRERFFITASYDLVVTGDLERARQTCILDTQVYPRDANIHGFLAGMIYPLLGQYDKALEESRKVIEANPEIGFGYNLFAANYLSIDRPADAEEVLNQAAAHKLDIPDFLLIRYQVAFLRGDEGAMTRVAAQAHGRPGGEDMIAGMEAFGLAYSGHLRDARDVSRRAVDLARQTSQKERAAAFETGAALREAFFGNLAEARQAATAALALSRGRDAQYGAALALALAGDSVQSENLTNDLERRFPEDTIARFNYVPTLRAQLALNQREPARAIEMLQRNVPYELGVPPSSFLGLYGPLYPIYMRGEAYLAEHRGPEAAAEFQKILSHRGIVIADPIGALAHLQLGRAYALSGDTASAKAAYGDFLKLWKDADPGIAILQQAQTEYRQLGALPNAVPVR